MTKINKSAISTKDSRQFELDRLAFEVPKEAIEAAARAMLAAWIVEAPNRSNALFPAAFWAEIGMEAALKAAAPYMNYQAGFNTGGAISIDLCGTFNEGIEAAAKRVEELSFTPNAFSTAIRALKRETNP